VTDRGIPRPRDREVYGRRRAGEDLVQRQTSAGTQDTMNLLVEPLFVRDVHRAVLRPHHIEASFRVRHVHGAALPEGDEVAQASTDGERRPGAAELLRDVEHLHRATEHARESTGRSAKATADVEHPHPGRNAGAAREVQSRLPTVDVELVHRGEVFHVEGVRVFPGGAQRAEYRRGETRVAVVFVHLRVMSRVTVDQALAPSIAISYPRGVGSAASSTGPALSKWSTPVSMYPGAPVRAGPCPAISFVTLIVQSFRRSMWTCTNFHP
jgi:hypothetical protein